MSSGRTAHVDDIAQINRAAVQRVAPGDTEACTQERKGAWVRPAHMAINETGARPPAEC